MSTQAALYEGIDLELSWSEHELPERERTKHVHRLHPYLGKFVPQLVEAFLYRYGRPGDLVWDPFVGSGTTLVEANAFGARVAGCDVSAFNCLLARVQTAVYEPRPLLADVVRLCDEIGRGVKGYCEDVAAVLRRSAEALAPRGRIVVVVNDSRRLFDGILEGTGLRLEERFLRHVNRRTGRRAGEYFEEVLIARP